MKDAIPVLAIVLLCAFFLGGLGYLIYTTEERAMRITERCIESGMQYIRGSCVR